MVTKKQILNKMKVAELKQIASAKSIEVKGRKSDIVEALTEQLSKDDIFSLRSTIIVPKPAFNIFLHEIVPEHKLLTPEQADAVLKKYNCSPEQLPKIHYTDPAVKILKAKPGDIVEIERNSPTAGKTTYYRVVTL